MIMAKVVNFFIPLNIGWVRNTANLAAVLGTCSNYEYIYYILIMQYLIYVISLSFCYYRIIVVLSVLPVFCFFVCSDIRIITANKAQYNNQQRGIYLQVHVFI